MSNLLKLKNLGWILTFIVAFFLGKSGFSKLMGTEEMVGIFKSLNLLDYMRIVGLAEIATLVLLMIPRTSLYGAIMVTSLMSAAAVIHLTAFGGQGVIFPIMVGLFSWTGHCLRKYFYY
jgi:hypothetical protein